MGRRRFRSVVLFLLVLLILGGSLGCQEMILNNGVFNRFSKISQLWPNQDGMQWLYHYTIRSWEQDPWVVFDDPADVPPAPSMKQVMRLLVTHPVGEGLVSQDYKHQMTFIGEITTGPGVTAQNLIEYTHFSNEESAQVATFSHSDAFLLRFAEARPDLRERIIERLSPEAAASLAQPGEPVQHTERVARGPLLIHGGAWEKTSQYIGTYGDVDTLLAWKFLSYRVSTGSEFTHQLVPSLASDVFLHARVVGRFNVNTEAGPFRKAVRVAYVIDYGVTTTFGTSETGYWRVFDYGYVDYVPNVGPVASYERSLVDAGNLNSRGVGDQALDLIRTKLTDIR